MSEMSVFYRETKSIVDIVIQTTVDLIGKLNEENPAKEPDKRREVSGQSVLY